jgi:hypothetical protein
MPEDTPLPKDDPLPADPKERKKVLAIARRALEKFDVEGLSDYEVEIMLKRSWLEWEPKIRHVLAKSGQLEF